MKKALWIGGGLLLLMLLLLWRAPVWLLTDRLAEAFPELVLGPGQGTLWSAELDALSYQDFNAQGLRWQLRPWGLLSGLPLSVEVAAPAQLRARVGVSQGQLTLADASAQGSIAPLLAAAALPSMGFDGRFTATVDSARLSASGCQALQGRLRVMSLRGDLPGIDSIGPVQAQLSCKAGALLLDVNEDNATRIRGQLRLPPNGRIDGQLSLSPAPGSPLFESLRQLLGQPRNGKDFVLRF